MRYSLILLVFGTIFLSSCGTQDTNTLPGTNDSTGITQSSIPGMGNIDYEAALKNTSAVIKNSQEFKECMSPAVNMCENSVGMRMAQEKKSEAICEELSQPANKESCRTVVLSLIAQEKNDINACDTLSATSKTTCRIQYLRREAVSKKSIPDCKKIANELPQNDNSGSISMPKGNNGIDQCMLEVINSLENPAEDSCNVIEDSMVKRMCTDTIKQRNEMKKMISTMAPPESINQTSNLPSNN